MKKNIIVIGSGIGGLATAVRLLSKGYSVKVLEKNTFIGGVTSQIKTMDLSFDLSASIMMMPEKYIELFQYINKDITDYLTLIPLNPIYKVFYHDGTELTIPSDLSTLIKNLESISIDDSIGYMKFLNNVYKKFKIADKYFLQRSQNNISDLISPSSLYNITHLNPLITSYSYISKYIKNEKLRELLAFQSMYVGISPYNSSNIYTLVPVTTQLYGLYHIKGGMFSLVKALEKLIYELGGTIETSTEVTEILIDNLTAVGIKTQLSQEHCDIVVCNCDFSSAIKTLIKKEEYKRDYIDSKIDKLKYSCSTFILHLGLDKKYPILGVHNIFIGRDFKENIEAPFNGSIPTNPSYYIYRPTAIDESMAKDGMDSINVMVRVPNLLFNSVTWSQSIIENIKSKILHDLTTINGLEDIESHISYMSYTTPEDFEKNFNTYGGCAFGLSHTLTQTNYFRPQALYKPVTNLYFVGASTHPGTGVSMVLTSSKLCTEEILKHQP